MITWMYLLVLVIAVLMTASILVKNRKVDNAFILFGVLLILSSGGQYMLAVSETVEAAVWANKILYVGGCYLPFVAFIIVTRLCNIRVNRYFKLFLLAYASIVLGFVMSVGHNGLYYVSVEVAQGNGFNYLVKEYGPFHVLYPVMMILYSVMLISFIVYAVKKRKEIPTRTVVTMSLLCSGVFLTYIFEKLIGTEVSYLQVGYIIGMVLLMRYFDRINMYDMSANILSSVEKLQEYAKNA